MKKRYEKPVIEVIELCSDDILLLSLIDTDLAGEWLFT